VVVVTPPPTPRLLAEGVALSLPRADVDMIGIRMD